MMSSDETSVGPSKARRPTIATWMVLIAIAALVLAPLVWGYRAMIRDRMMLEVMRHELAESAYRADADRQRVQVELQKATFYAPQSSDRESILRDENERLRAEVERLGQRVAELEKAGAAP